MYTGLLHLHSSLRWIILLLLVVAIVRHFSAIGSKRPVNAGDRRIDLFLMTSAHITLLIGLYQWFAGEFGLKLIQHYGMKAVLHTAWMRFWAVEHITGMLIAIILITIGRGAVKRGSGTAVHKKAGWLFLLALIIILASVPWPFREGIGRTLMP